MTLSECVRLLLSRRDSAPELSGHTVFPAWVLLIGLRMFMRTSGRKPSLPKTWTRPLTRANRRKSCDVPNVPRNRIDR